MHKAKSQLSALLKQVERGEEVIIRRGTYGPRFRLISVPEKEPERVMESKPEWKEGISYTDEALWESEWEGE